MNAEYLLNSRYITSKPTLMIPNDFMYILELTTNRRILFKILYVVGNSDIPLHATSKVVIMGKLALFRQDTF